jgi:hypothetical protein
MGACLRRWLLFLVLTPCIVEFENVLGHLGRSLEIKIYIHYKEVKSVFLKKASKQISRFGTSHNSNCSFVVYITTLFSNPEYTVSNERIISE